MKEYYDEEEYLEDIYGDEIKVGDEYYEFKLINLDRIYYVHEKNLKIFALDELDLIKRER